MNGTNERNGCQMGCWLMAGAIGLVVFIMMTVLSEMAILSALLGAVIVTGVVGLLLSWILCRPVDNAQPVAAPAKPAAPVASAAPTTAPAAAAPVAAPAAAAPVTAPAPAAAADLAPELVADTTATPAPAEMAVDAPADTPAEVTVATAAADASAAGTASADAEAAVPTNDLPATAAPAAAPLLAMPAAEADSAPDAPAPDAPAPDADATDDSADGDAAAETAADAAAEAADAAAEAAAPAADRAAIRKARAEARAAKAARAATLAEAAPGGDDDGDPTPATPGKKPEGLSAPRAGQADDLKIIEGIGPVLEQRLNGWGIWHYDQIAAWGPEEVAYADQNVPRFKGRASRDKWVAQARIIVADGIPAFLERAKTNDY